MCWVAVITEPGLVPTDRPDVIAARIRARRDSLPPAEAKVADLVLHDPDQVVNSTVMELKSRLGVSEATIVRAARSLGFAGYAQLRLSLAAAAGQRQIGDLPPVATGDISRDDSTADVIAKLATAEQQALRQTVAHLDADVLRRAAVAVAAANRIVAFGVGASGLVAQDLQHKLARAGLSCSSSPDIELTLTSVALLAANDVVVLISHGGRTLGTLDVLAAAKRSKAVSIVITSSEASPLARGANYLLVAAGHDMEFRPAALASRMGQLLVIDCLFVAVIQRTWSKTSAALSVTRAAIDDRRRSPRG